MNLGSQKLTLELEGETLVLKGQKVNASFQTMPSEDFPRLYEDKGEEIASFKKNEAEESIQRVAFAPALDSSRPALSGILLDKDKNTIILVATDGVRLSLQKNAFKTNKELDKPIIIPARVVRELFTIKEDEPLVKIYISERNNQIIFIQGETILVSRLISGVPGLSENYSTGF